jgi:hypothetical protein
LGPVSGLPLTASTKEVEGLKKLLLRSTELFPTVV